MVGVDIAFYRAQSEGRNYEAEKIHEELPGEWMSGHATKAALRSRVKTEADYVCMEYGGGDHIGERRPRGQSEGLSSAQRIARKTPGLDRATGCATWEMSSIRYDKILPFKRADILGTSKEKFLALRLSQRGKRQRRRRALIMRLIILRFPPVTTGCHTHVGKR
jgi:hypothetical protein